MRFLGITKPSEALEAMIKGLQKADRRKTFVIDMGTFGDGDVGAGICFGCAATCTLQELSGVNFTPEVLSEWDSMPRRKMAIGSGRVNSLLKVLKFENAIDRARGGKVAPLIEFFDCERRWMRAGGGFYFSFDLDTHNWKEQLPEVRKLIKQLKAAGC